MTFSSGVNSTPCTTPLGAEHTLIHGEDDDDMPELIDDDYDDMPELIDDDMPAFGDDISMSFADLSSLPPPYPNNYILPPGEAHEPMWYIDNTAPHNAQDVTERLRQLIANIGPLPNYTPNSNIMPYINFDDSV